MLVTTVTLAKWLSQSKCHLRGEGQAHMGPRKHVSDGAYIGIIINWMICAQWQCGLLLLWQLVNLFGNSVKISGFSWSEVSPLACLCGRQLMHLD